MLPDFISKLVYQLSVGIRNPSLNNIYRQLKQSEHFSREQLYNLQFERVQSLLNFASRYSPYYRAVFDQHGIDVNAIRNLDDFRQIPITDKKTLIAHSAEIHTAYNFSKVFKAETSGTTGNALEFTKNEEWDSTNRAALMRAYDWYGVKPWQYSGYLWGFNISGLQATKVQLLDFLQNRARLFNYHPDEIQKFAGKLHSASFLTGYSSMVYEIAKVINQQQNFSLTDFHNIKLIAGTSETILDIYKTEVEKALGLVMRSEYGAAEAGLIAYECPQGRLHINVENVLLETNQNNEAIVTNLASFSFPVIRYNLGDIIELNDDSVYCDCGIAHPTIKSLSGRKGATIQGKANQYPALTFYYVFKNLAIEEKLFLNYRAFQNEAGSVTLKIEQNKSERSESRLKAQLQNYFGDDVNVNIEWSASFEAARDSKVQYFNTTLE